MIWWWRRQRHVAAVLLLLHAVAPLRVVRAFSCVNITSAVHHAGDPGAGSGSLCQPYKVNISVVAGSTEALSEASLETLQRAPVMDVAVIVDESGSVRSLCGNIDDCYDDERNFATELVTLLDERVSLFSRGGTAVYMEYSTIINDEGEFTTKQDFLDYVDSRSMGGGSTSIGLAIHTATDTMVNLPGREDRSQMMVVMTDGHDSGNSGYDPSTEANLARAEGITVWVVAVDYGGTTIPQTGCYYSSFLPSCIDRETMLDVAGATERLYEVVTFGGLADDVATEIIAGVEVPCVINATLTFGMDKAPYEAPHVNAGTVEVVDRTVTWNLDSLGSTTRSLNYSVDYCECGYRGANVTFVNNATFDDAYSNELDYTEVYAMAAEIDDVSCTPSPSPSSTPAPSEAPTPAPTPPPTPAPTPGPTPPPTPEPTLFPTPAPRPSPTRGPTPQPTVTAPDTLFVGVVGLTENVDGAWEAVYSQDGAHVYVTGLSSNNVAVLDVDPADGSLEFSGNASFPGEGAAPASAFDGASELAMSPDGGCLYVAAVGNESLASLSVDAESGSLAYVGAFSGSAMGGASDLLVSPDGGHVYVSSMVCGCILAFGVDEEEGACGIMYEASFSTGLVLPTGLALSPDGGTLYATDFALGALLRFERDAGTGVLTLMQTLDDGDNALTRLEGARSVAVGPSGRDAYVASSGAGALVHFCVDETTGELVAIEWSESETTPLSGASLVAVDSTNSHVFVASASNDTLWVLDISEEPDDSGCALLELQDIIREGDEDRIAGLDGASGIAVSPDGLVTIVVGHTTGYLGVFRDTTAFTATPSPTPPPAPVNASGEDDIQDWELGVGIGVPSGLVALAGLWYLLNRCCCWGAAAKRKREKLECPSCRRLLGVDPEGLTDDAKCWCDVSRSRAEDIGQEDAGAAATSANEIQEEQDTRGDEVKPGKHLFHPGSEYMAKCPNCSIVFCVPCDVRDGKQMYPFLYENSNQKKLKENRRISKVTPACSVEETRSASSVPVGDGEESSALDRSVSAMESGSQANTGQCVVGKEPNLDSSLDTMDAMGDAEGQQETSRDESLDKLSSSNPHSPATAAAVTGGANGVTAMDAARTASSHLEIVRITANTGDAEDLEENPRDKGLDELGPSNHGSSAAAAAVVVAGDANDVASTNAARNTSSLLEVVRITANTGDVEAQVETSRDNNLIVLGPSSPDFPAAAVAIAGVANGVTPAAATRNTSSLLEIVRITANTGDDEEQAETSRDKNLNELSPSRPDSPAAAVVVTGGSNGVTATDATRNTSSLLEVVRITANTGDAEEQEKTSGDKDLDKLGPSSHDSPAAAVAVANGVTPVAATRKTSSLLEVVRITANTEDAEDPEKTSRDKDLNELSPSSHDSPAAAVAVANGVTPAAATRNTSSLLEVVKITVNTGDGKEQEESSRDKNIDKIGPAKS